MKPGFETYWLIWFEGLSAGCERSPEISERNKKDRRRSLRNPIRCFDQADAIAAVFFFDPR